jgi:hypothetical protein
MFIPQLLLALASLTVAVMPDLLARTEDQPSAQAAQPTKEILATVEAVNVEEKTFKIAETSEVIVVTRATVFDDEVQLDKLRSGTKVRIVGVPSADGKFQATEIRVAK